MAIPGWAKALAIGAGAFVAGAAALNQVVIAGVAETYSPDWYSESSAEAARRGVLVSRLTVQNPRIEYRGGAVTVREAWVERVTQVRYRWYLLRTEEKKPLYRLVMPYRTEGAPYFTCAAGIVYSDSVSLVDGGRAFDRVSRTPSFPPVLRVAAARRRDCPPSAADARAR